MSKKKTTEQFIEDARKVHGDKYDYSKVVYVNKTTKVCIMCKEHGEFWQTPCNHLRGQNCRKCEAKKRVKWNYETCYEEAKKYKTKGDFAIGNCSAYDAARRNKWLDDYIWFKQIKKPNGYWTHEACYEEAKKYKTKNEFKKCCESAYHIARKNKWLKDYTWFVDGNKLRTEKDRKWNYKTCYEEAKKYKTKTEFIKGSNGAYVAARRNKWLDEYTWLKKIKNPKPNKYWTYETCFEEAKNTNQEVTSLRKTIMFIMLLV